MSARHPLLDRGEKIGFERGIERYGDIHRRRCSIDN
jgi:hypothetical protein